VNTTKRQHFVSQAEQRLNALNPAAEERNQKLFSFSLIDRESYTVSLDTPRGRAISSNLLLYDLFSFHVTGQDGTRFNFEALFRQYESDMTANTLELLRKLQRGISDIKAEVLNIFTAKFMNFLRNPYSVKKVLNTIGKLGTFYPTDPYLLEQYSAILAGKKPQQRYICSQLEITPAEYQAWLSALFMVLMRPSSGELNLLESIVKNLYEDPSNDVLVCVHQYVDEHSDKRCLLSDRGYSIPIPEGKHLAFSFNLCSNAFITYVFVDIEKAAPERTNPYLLEAYKKRQKKVTVRPSENDLAALSSYNRNVVYQCSHAVYSSSQNIYGLRLPLPEALSSTMRQN
jgi:hypothetical protein